MNATNPTTRHHRLAAAINALRPDWPITSLETLFTNPTLRNRATPDLAVAAVRLALNPECKTPGPLLHPGPHWRNTNPGANDDTRPTPPPITQLSLGVDNPADPTPHIERIRATLRHKRGQAIPPAIRDTIAGTG